MRHLALAALAALTLAVSPPSRADERPADVAAAPSCRHCGMDREKFAQSRMLIVHEDGKEVGLCSLHCAAVELAVALDGAPKAIRVADLGTKALVDAEQAVWVIGGAKPGVMTRRAKWAFADRAAAEAFAREQGGTLATFEEAIRAAYEDMYQDTKMIREKRRMMRSKTQGEPPAPAVVPAAAAAPAPAKATGKRSCCGG